MVVPVLVVTHHPLLNTLLSHVNIDMDLSVGRIPLCRHDPQFHGVQCGSGVSIRHICQEVHGLLVDHRIVDPHALILVVDGPVDQFSDVLPLQRLQFKHPGTGKKRSVHLEVRILCGGADQSQRPILHKRK